MSRGHGRLQQDLLRLLDENPRALDTFTLAASVYGCSPNADGRMLVNDAQLVAVRRAMAGLVKQGKAFDLGRHWHAGRRHWAGERYGLYCTIRRMQMLNTQDAALGREKEVVKRTRTMLPLLRRAGEL